MGGILFSVFELAEAGLSYVMARNWEAEIR